MSEARVIERTIVERWEAVAGPLACLCGHEHYGRVKHSAQAPQWHICEDEACLCRALRRAPTTAGEGERGEG
jgi:hypothetical protein